MGRVAFSSFRHDEHGGIAIIFAASLFPMLAGVGMAVDYSIASNARSAVHAAADAAALAGAQTRGTDADREKAAKAVFNANIDKAKLKGSFTANFTNLKSGDRNTGYQVAASGDVPLFFGGITLAKSTGVAATATATTGSPEPIEIVFVLDTTDSMSGDRIKTLKETAVGLVKDIEKKDIEKGLVKIGVVPFSQYVNIGLSRRNEPWLSVDADYKTPDQTSCWDHWDVTGWKNCRKINHPAVPPEAPKKCMVDGRERLCGGHNGWGAWTEDKCDPIHASTSRRVCEKKEGKWVRWHGCVGSRAYPLNLQDGSYSTKIPGLLGQKCGTEIQDLTTNFGKIISTINSLDTQGETYLPSGLIWGWRMLSAQEPLAAVTPSGAKQAKKYMILVTDGRNTKSPNYPKHDGNDGNKADALTKELCANIAKDGATKAQMFTVAFEMDGLAAKKILEDCAKSTGGDFYDATDASRLKTAFGDILNSIFTLRLTQ